MKKKGPKTMRGMLRKDFTGDGRKKLDTFIQEQFFWEKEKKKIENGGHERLGKNRGGPRQKFCGTTEEEKSKKGFQKRFYNNTKEPDTLSTE